MPELPLLVEHSPIKQIPHMPKIPYLFIQGDKDDKVAKKHHSDRMVAEMKKRKFKVEYIEVPGMGHGGPMPVEVIQRNIDFVTAAWR